MSDGLFNTEQLQASLQKALATLQRQANDEHMPANVRRQSARTLERYQRALKRYPFLRESLHQMPEQEQHS